MPPLRSSTYDSAIERAVAILVIEDEPGIADFVRRGLEAAGFTVEVESDGALGLLAAQGENVQLVILDLGLPGLSGEEVLTTIPSSG